MKKQDRQKLLTQYEENLYKKMVKNKNNFNDFCNLLADTTLINIGHLFSAKSKEELEDYKNEWFTRINDVASLLKKQKEDMNKK